MNRKLTTTLKFSLPLLILAIAGAAAATLSGMRTDPETRAVEPELPLVRVQVVEPVDHTLRVQSQGTVQPRTESRLVPEVPGRVVWVSPNFVSGGFFEAGDPLLRLDSHDFEQAVVRTRAEVAAAKLRLAQEEAEADIARREWEELGEGSPPELTVRVPQLENARAAVAAAEANRVQAERNLARTQLGAPYAGRVRDKTVDVGQFVAAGTPVGSIYAIDIAEIRLPLPDEDLAYLSSLPLLYRGDRAGGGPRVMLYADFAGRRHEWEGRLVRTEGEIDPSSRMVHAIAQVRDPYGRSADSTRPPLAVGMYVRAEIEGDVARGVYLLPRAALRADGSIVLVDPEERLRIREVTVLRGTRENIVVSAGLEPGDRVMLSTLDVVVEGMRVRVGEGAR